jgi:serine phosphatase RsbU (regulator of sigma subunit)
MSLRLRLIVAFFLLSVVPLGAVTSYTYLTSARAVRGGARNEAEQLAVELAQRMELVMAQLGERVGNLMAMSTDPAMVTQAAVARFEALPGELEGPSRTAPPSPSPAPAASPAPAQPAGPDEVALALGDVAMLLNNIEVRGGGFGRRGGQPGGRGDRGGRGRGEGRGEGRGPQAGGGPPPPPAGTTGAPPPGRENEPPRGAVGGDPSGRSGQGAAEARGGRGRGPVEPPSSGDLATVEADRIRIDLMPIRKEIMQQLVGAEDWNRLSPEERQRILAQVNQRMLGITQGIELSKVELQKKVAAAQQAADAKAREVAKAARVAPAPATRTPGAPPPTPAVSMAGAQRKVALSGSKLDVRMERDGEVVRQINADVNLSNFLATVFTTRRRLRGEVPFAVASDGQVYAPSADDRARVEALGEVARPETPPGTTMLADWIVVTSADPTGSGLKLGIARPVGESLHELRQASARAVGLGLGFIGLALIGIVPLSSRLTRNLSTLSDGVRRIAQGDYRARVSVNASDEVGRLARAFNQMAEDVEQHQRSAVGQERIRRELELGRQIQHDMLPQGPLQVGLVEVSGVSVPAREVGGDFFNYFVLGDGSVALLVGDVSGKGVGAALLMANLQASLRTRLALGQDLAAVARELDVDIEDSTPGPVYATLFVGILNPATRELRYVNAGHNPQYVLRGGNRLERMYSSGLPVGLLAGRGYAESRVALASGDRLFFYTDGCVEAENADGEMFTTERLEGLLLTAAGDPDLLARIEAEVSAFRGTREPFDDATMMVVKIG